MSTAEDWPSGQPFQPLPAEIQTPQPAEVPAIGRGQEIIDKLNNVRDEDWGGRNESFYSSELGLRRLGEDLVAVRLHRAGSTVLIVGEWNAAEDLDKITRRVRRGQWTLPEQVFEASDAVGSKALHTDLQKIYDLRHPRRSG